MNESLALLRVERFIVDNATVTEVAGDSEDAVNEDYDLELEDGAEYTVEAEDGAEGEDTAEDTDTADDTDEVAEE